MEDTDDTLHLSDYLKMPAQRIADYVALLKVRQLHELSVVRRSLVQSVIQYACSDVVCISFRNFFFFFFGGGEGEGGLGGLGAGHARVTCDADADAEMLPVVSCNNTGDLNGEF